MKTRKYLSATLVLFLLVSATTFAQNIFRTACQGNIERLDSLLSPNSIDTIDYRGRSLLHWSVACEEQTIFDYLIENGAKINMKDDDGATPLHIAILYNRDSLFNQLIALQPDDNWKADDGASLVEKAILKRNLSFVQKLIGLGVSINAKNNRGSTPLEIAKKTGAKEITQWLISTGADESLVRIFVLKGSYFGQNPPELEPKLFAPNFISIEEYEFGSVFNKAGTEFYYGVDVNGKPEIRYSKLVNNTWSQPKLLLPDDQFDYNDPFLSPDEQRLYFISRRPKSEADDTEDHDIWFVERTSNGWSDPINAGSNINSDGNEYYISFTSKGTMYFSSSINAPEENTDDLDIYYSQFINGKFQQPVRLGNSINTENYEADVFVAPDESYLIFCSTRPEGLGRGDLYVSFKKTDGTWSKAKNMGETINTKGHELCPFVTTDGKFFLYTSNEDIYWVDTRILERYRED